MGQIALLVSAIFVLRLLRHSGVLDRFLHFLRSTSTLHILTGCVAWLITGLALWGLWRMWCMIRDISAMQFNFISVILLAAIAMGLAYLYQLVVTYSAPGATERIWKMYLSSILFRPASLAADWASGTARPEQSAPGATIGLGDELDRLLRNDAVDITDSWQMQCHSLAPHPLYIKVTTAQVDPRRRTLRLNLNLPEVERELLSSVAQYSRMKQGTYQFLQSLRDVEWIQPYIPFYDTVLLKFFGTMTDTLGQPHPYLFMTVEMKFNEVRKSDGRIFDAGKLDTIARIDFRNGDPVS